MKKLINDLYDYESMKIYQYEEGFKFSLDSILLAESVIIHKNDKNILDLCTGNAVIPLVLSTKTNLPINGIEIQKEIFELATDSINYNNKQNQIYVINDNIKEAKSYFPGNNFDIITCNPPYFKFHHPDFLNQSDLKQIARHEVSITLKEMIDVASHLLKNKGNFYLVHIPERFQEILILLEEYNLSVKDVYFVYPKQGKDAVLVLIRSLKLGRNGLKVHEPIYLNKIKTYKGLFQGGEKK